MWRAGPTGAVVTVDRNLNHLRHARTAIKDYFGEIPSQLSWHQHECGGLEAGESDVACPWQGDDKFDAAVVDVGEPWNVLPKLPESLKPGARVVVYSK